MNVVCLGIEAEIRTRQAAELKTLEAENMAAELASALSVMTAHCEDLERQAAEAAAREAEVCCSALTRFSIVFGWSILVVTNVALRA